MKITKEELMDVDNKHLDGYRLVYFKSDGTYSIGAYCKTIEGFMIGFAPCYPINDEGDIPPFISIDDLLERSLEFVSAVESVAIYKTDGTLIAKKDRTKQNTK
jgi:hypothetical protein